MNLLRVLLIATAVRAEQLPADVPVVPVFLKSEGPFSVVVQARAKAEAAAILASAGIRLEWVPKADPGRRGLIVISLQPSAPKGLQRGSMAQAFPFEGTRANIFMDRVTRTAAGQQRLLPSVLAHVIGHEIGHILFATTNHTGSGMMKAHWSVRDLQGMSFRSLAFSEQEAELLHAGLQRRATGVVLASFR